MLFCDAGSIACQCSVTFQGCVALRENLRNASPRKERD